MFVRLQKVRQAGRVYEYVHIVEGYRDQDGKVRHRVVANLGRRDRLKASGALDNLAGAFTRLDPAPGRFLVGALPLVAPLLDRLDVVGIVDRACPSGAEPPSPTARRSPPWWPIVSPRRSAL